MPSTFDAVTWQMNHTSLLNEVRDRLEVEGRTVLTENQSYFNLRGNSGTVIGGKPDLVALDTEGGGTVYDIKTGQPRASDSAQVMIYMYALPHINQFRGMHFDGRVVYPDDRQVEIPADSVNDAFKTELFSLIRRLADPGPARRVPSALECGMCELTPADCPERVDGGRDGLIADGGEF